MSTTPPVVVVGGGISGLACARALQASGTRVIVLEATGAVGGRIRGIRPLREDGSVGERVELGPEFIHGRKDNVLVDVVKQGLRNAHGRRVKLREMAWPNYVYMGKEGKLYTPEEVDSDKEVAAAMKRFEDIATDLEVNKGNTLLQYIAEKGVRSRVLDLVDAVVANDYGAEMCDIGCEEAVLEQQRWRHGEAYLSLLDGDWADFVQYYRDGLTDVRLEMPVQRVEWSSNGAVVLCSNGDRIEARAVVVTVSLGVLKHGSIRFSPPLPAGKQHAIERVGFGNAVKMLFKFRRKFWPDDFYDCVCADAFLPEVWITPPYGHERASDTRQQPSYTMVAFVTGERATRVAALGEDDAARIGLAQLDAMFGRNSNDMSERFPASTSVTSYLLHDWESEEYFRGGYSYPSNGDAHMRERLRESCGCLFWAGEATEHNINPCVNGAIQTGQLAAKQVLQHLQEIDLNSATRSKL